MRAIVKRDWRNSKPFNAICAPKISADRQSDLFFQGHFANKLLYICFGTQCFFSVLLCVYFPCCNLLPALTIHQNGGSQKSLCIYLYAPAARLCERVEGFCAPASAQKPSTLSLKSCAYDLCTDMQPSEAMASRRGPIDRAHGVERGKCLCTNRMYTFIESLACEASDSMRYWVDIKNVYFLEG